MRPATSRWQRRSRSGASDLPDELARAALFPAFDDSSFVTGIDMHVDGGVALT
ncbi:MAG: SDR family oxidoreductase [Limnobacter sp.]|nr:SDR family oxidoreductase [Limnobacter sp.]